MQCQKPKSGTQVLKAKNGTANKEKKTIEKDSSENMNVQTVAVFLIPKTYTM